MWTQGRGTFWQGAPNGKCEHSMEEKFEPDKLLRHHPGEEGILVLDWRDNLFFSLCFKLLLYD